nr:transposase [Amycolatopsis niigatensis]
MQAHLTEVYDAEVSRQTISTITDKVMEGMAEWQNRPLDPAVHPVIFVDAIHVKIRPNLARRFTKIRDYAVMFSTGFLAKQHLRTRAFGRRVIAFSSGNQLGLIILDGTVVAPRPFRIWRAGPNIGGKRRR